MIGVKTHTLPGKVGEVKADFARAAVRTIGRMAAYQRAVERDLMQDAPKGIASAPGTAPHSHSRTSRRGTTMKTFKDFIFFKPEGKGFDTRFVVGPDAPSKGRRKNWAERIGKTHEFGGTTTVEKRVVYRPVRAGEGGGTGLKGHRGRFRSKGVVLFNKGERTFDFTIHNTKKMRSGKVMFLISHKATDPKRPFAAPALRKTTAAMRQGKFK